MYPDQFQPGLLRWFDGVKWTGHVQPMHAPVPGHNVTPYAGQQLDAPGHSPRDPVHWLVPLGRTWQSIAAGYVGLLAFGIWVLGPVALWLGIAALRASAAGRGRGRGRAWFAIGAGVLATVCMVLYVMENLL